MLVLSRKSTQEIVIGDNEIVFTVVEIRGDKVRIGIDAPKDVGVHRREVFEAIKKSGGEVVRKPTAEAKPGTAD